MAHPLPPPGPDHYAARRARWLAPTVVQRPRHVPQSHARLQRLLDHPEPHSDPVWNRGIDQVWNGFINGSKLKHRLPMSLVVKVIHAAWRRDPETWPVDAVAPDSDEPCASASDVPGKPSAKPP